MVGRSHGRGTGLHRGRGRAASRAWPGTPAATQRFDPRVGLSDMREHVVQHAGHPYRVLYAFDPRRVAILLIGGDKTGDERWYDVNVPLADRLYEEHLETLKREENRRGAQ
jgi:hypothetical protein